MSEGEQGDMEGTAVASGTRYGDRKAAGKRPASMEFPEDLYQRLWERSQVEERSMAAITRHSVRKYLDEVEGQDLSVAHAREILAAEGERTRGRPRKGK